MPGKSANARLERRVDKSKRELVERLKAETAINEPWKQLISIFDAIDEKVYVSDPVTHEILYVNPAKRKVFGQDIVGQKCHKAFQELDAPCEFCTNPMIFGENLGKTHIWAFQNRKTGNWLRCIDRAIRWWDGRMVRFEMAIGIDDRKVAEHALRESERRYRDLLETMNEGFRIIDDKGLITYANQKFSEMLGYKVDEIVGRPAIEFLDEGSRKVWLREFEKRRQRKSSRYEMILVRKDRERVPVILSPRPIFDDKGVFRGSYSAITDIGDLKKAENALKEREKDLRAKTIDLEEVNAALRVLLKQMEQDKRELEDKIRLNIQQMIHPYLERMKTAGLSERQRGHLNKLEKNLDDIMSPFIQKLLTEHPRLTHAELQIANLLRQGKSSKEIADELGLSSRTVETHRRNMRTKLRIKGKKTNLRSYLFTNRYT